MFFQVHFFRSKLDYLTNIIGISCEVERLICEGKQWIKNHLGTLEIDFTDYKQHTELVLKGI